MTLPSESKLKDVDLRVSLNNIVSAFNIVILTKSSSLGTSLTGILKEVTEVPNPVSLNPPDLSLP